MQLFIIILSFLALIACDKPNPTPENSDPIYNEILNEASAVESQIKTTEKDLEGFEKDLKAVAPQTGQNKYAEKRVYETTAKLDKLKQMLQYWKMRAESRKELDRKTYLTAYKEKRPWPDPAEYEQYKLQRKLEQAPRNWDLKRRLEESRVGVALDPTQKSKSGDGEHGEAAPAEKAESSHGGTAEH